MDNNKKIIILGGGSGRCGTASLSALLHNCENSLVGHEIIPHLYWNITEDSWGYFLRRMRWFDNHPTTLTGDVFSVYLPYMKKLSKMESEFNWYGIILKRDKNKTVESFIDITGTRNNWQKNKVYNPMYVKSFPQYEDTIVGTDNDSKRKALELYWEEYYERAEKLANNEKRIRVFDIDVLNSKKGQDRVFDFIGLTEDMRKYIKDCKFNSRQDYKKRRKNGITMS